MTKKREKSKEHKLDNPKLQAAILQLFRDNPKKRYNPRQVIRKLQVANHKDSVLFALLKLAEAQHLTALEDFKFMLKKSAAPIFDKKIVEGYVDMTRSGAAYITTDGHEEDIFVAAKNLGSALHGDLVQVAAWMPNGRQKPEGEVIKILERATEQFVGTIWMRSKFALVVPSRQDVPTDIVVPFSETQDAQDGDRVVVQITKWHKNQSQRPEGRVVRVLSEKGSDLVMKEILINHGFPIEFSVEAIEEADEFARDISIQELHRRKDFRNIPTFTIDPEDAKDFDDALSLNILGNGHCEIGIHIADVTHYVKSESALDREAFRRSTSVYLVDRVLPMLPERLSNSLCSLRPGEDKLTFSAVFEFDKNHKIVNRWFGKTIIHSNRRFTYDEAQERLETGEGDFAKELKILNRIAKKLRKERIKNGSIDFDADEVRFRLDENGVPLEVYVKERKDAHMLIEDFMLLANREVAIFIHEKGKNQMEIPFVYRVHDYPNQDKVRELQLFAKELGFQMHINTPKEIARSFNRLTKLAAKEPAFKLLQPIAIRTMAKAEYSTENIGHYGLAFDFYTHFTSPIRRYSDVLVHRILEKNLGDATFRPDKSSLQNQCRHISLQERKAMEAERESIKFKQAEFISRHVGEEFYGYISGIIDRGIFVELEDSKCEGLINFENFQEPFRIDENRLKIRGLRSGCILKMGDRIKVRILSADLEKRRIEMELV